MKHAASESDREKQSVPTRRSDTERGTSSSGTRDRPVESLHRTMGNQAIQRLHEDGVLQAKLTVNRPNDRYEREADRVAEQVMRMPEPATAPSVAGQAAPTERIQRMCPRCQRRFRQGKPLDCPECEGELQRKETSSEPSAVDGGLERQIQALRGSGRPLSESERSFFEPRFGADFSGVRVHTGRRADEAARSVNAEAFTMGRDVVFQSGAYRPGTQAGKQLIAHELTHVVHQDEGASRTSDPTRLKQSLTTKQPLSESTVGELNIGSSSHSIHRKVRESVGGETYASWEQAQNEAERQRLSSKENAKKAAETTSFHLYTVRPGDSLSTIAEMFGIPGGWKTLYRLNKNRIDDPDRIYSGQRIRIPKPLSQSTQKLLNWGVSGSLPIMETPPQPICIGDALFMWHSEMDINVTDKTMQAIAQNTTVSVDLTQLEPAIAHEVEIGLITMGYKVRASGMDFVLKGKRYETSISIEKGVTIYTIKVKGLKFIFAGTKIEIDGDVKVFLRGIGSCAKNRSRVPVESLSPVSSSHIPQSTREKIMNWVEEVLENGLDPYEAAMEFLDNNPEIVNIVLLLGVAVLVTAIVTGIGQLGLNPANYVAGFIALALVSAALAKVGESHRTTFPQQSVTTRL